MEDEGFLAVIHEIRKMEPALSDLYARKYLMRRIKRRMGALGITKPERYALLLRRSLEERRALRHALSIPVTSFFRNPSTYLYIRDRIVPELIESVGEGHYILTAWSVGTATGEEAYSLAMLLLDGWRKRWGEAHPPLHVFGVEIEMEAIEIARAGRYNIPVRDLSTRPWGELLRRYMAHTKSDPNARISTLSPWNKAISTRQKAVTLQVTRELRKATQFIHNNIFEVDMKGGARLVLCRNLMIYFHKEGQIRLLRKLHAAMADGAFLVLGRSEHVPRECSGLFRLVDIRERIFRCVKENAASRSGETVHEEEKRGLVT